MTDDKHPPKADNVFDNLSDLVGSVDNDEQMLTQMESLCMSCGDNGWTRMMLTDIPYFRQVVVVSFECQHCGNQNNELQPVQEIRERAVRFEVKCRTPEDLSRRVVKTEWAAIEIPELEFEITKQTGLITTVEGILERAIDGLKHTIKSFTDEDLLLSENVSSRQKLCDFVLKLTHLKEGNDLFTFILTDISGNSYVESLCAPPAVDPQVDSTHFIRTIDEDKLLGIYEFGVDNDRTATEETQAVANKLQDEVLRFPTNCPNCSAPAFTNMKVQQIPHFKEVVIMATNCDACGHKTNEVKSGSGIEDKGIRITLKVGGESDLERDVVISDTCSLAIPELDIHMTGTGSGRYTTVEGIASTIIDDLKRHNPFVFGDSAKEDVRQRMADLAAKLESLVGRTLVLDDPCGNSYVSGDGLDVERYDRSHDQNEELGLNDIKTENYS